MTIPLLIDCDTGIDDSLALLYACASPDAELIAVTCVAGNVDAVQVGINTRAVLELVGRAGIPVALGRRVPIMRPLVTTPETHGPQGLGDAALAAPTSAISDRHAVDLIIDAARTRPGELTLVTLGPMTNLAVAVLREPELPRLLRRLVLMGGAYGAPGNTTPVAEWNAMVDPEAFGVVLRAWSPDGPVDWAGSPPPRPMALGLDVTEQVRFLPEHLEQLRSRVGQAGSPVMELIDGALAFYFRFHERFDGFTGAFIHDPLAVAAALDPMLVETRAVTVDIELGGNLAVGQTIADWRHHWDRPPNLDVALSADAPAFLARFIDRIGGLAVERAGWHATRQRDGSLDEEGG